MELHKEFRVGVAADTAWQILTDVERIAPCLPGAQLLEIEGEEYRGVVKVRVGPVTAQYKGKANVVEQDESDLRVVLRAAGRDVGGGNANATITAVVTPDGEAARISVLIGLQVTGQASQFGRAIMTELCTNLLGEFVACVERTLVTAGVGATSLTPVDGGDADHPPVAAGASSATAAGQGAPLPAARRVEGPEVEPVDVLPIVTRSVVKRVLPLVGAVIAIVVLRQWRRRGR